MIIINFFIHAILYSWEFYYQHLIIILLSTLGLTLFLNSKYKISLFLKINIIVFYIINVIVISLWKWPPTFKCLNTSIYYRPLFSKMHWVPGNFIVDTYHSYLNTHDILHASKFFVFTLLNIIYFIPLGIMLRWFFKWNKFWIIIFGLGLSLLIEYLQISGINYLYNCSWRYFDIDDVIMNLIGTIIGVIIVNLGVNKWQKRK